MIDQKLEELKALVLDGGFEQEAKEQVAEIERQVKEALGVEGLSQHPAIIRYVTYLTDEVDRCNFLLTDSPELTEHQRLQIWARKEEAKRFLRIFDTYKQSLESTIDNLLEIAKQ